MARDWLDILQEMEQWSRDMDRFMTHINSRSRPFSAAPGPATWNPAVNIYEIEDAYLVAAELAGVDPEEINIKYEGNRLLVWGVRRELIPDGVRAVHRMEIEFGSYAFLVELPGMVTSEGTDAHLEHGILQIRLPKQSITGRGSIPVRTSERPQAELGRDTGRDTGRSAGNQQSQSGPLNKENDYE